MTLVTEYKQAIEKEGVLPSMVTTAINLRPLVRLTRDRANRAAKGIYKYRRELVIGPAKLALGLALVMVALSLVFVPGGVWAGGH